MKAKKERKESEGGRKEGRKIERRPGKSSWSTREKQKRYIRKLSWS